MNANFRTDTDTVSYAVTVGNVGCVLTTNNLDLAGQTFRDYVRVVRGPLSRAEWPVVIWKNDEPLQEHNGTC